MWSTGTAFAVSAVRRIVSRSRAAMSRALKLASPVTARLSWDAAACGAPRQCSAVGGSVEASACLAAWIVGSACTAMIAAGSGGAAAWKIVACAAVVAQMFLPEARSAWARATAAIARAKHATRGKGDDRERRPEDPGPDQRARTGVRPAETGVGDVAMSSVALGIPQLQDFETIVVENVADASASAFHQPGSLDPYSGSGSDVDAIGGGERPQAMTAARRGADRVASAPQCAEDAGRPRCALCGSSDCTGAIDPAPHSHSARRAAVLAAIVAIASSSVAFGGGWTILGAASAGAALAIAADHASAAVRSFGPAEALSQQLQYGSALAPEPDPEGPARRAARRTLATNVLHAIALAWWLTLAHVLPRADSPQSDGCRGEPSRSALSAWAARLWWLAATAFACGAAAASARVSARAASLPDVAACPPGSRPRHPRLAFFEEPLDQRIVYAVAFAVEALAATASLSVDRAASRLADSTLTSLELLACSLAVRSASSCRWSAFDAAGTWARIAGAASRVCSSAIFELAARASSSNPFR